VAEKTKAASGRVAVQLKRLDDFVHVLFFDEPFVGGQEVAGEVAEMILKVGVRSDGGWESLVEDVPHCLEFTTQEGFQKRIARSIVGIKRIVLASLEEVGQDAKQAFLIGGVWAEGEDVLSSDAGVFGEQAMFDL
jgi:hypothetical protein